MSEKKPASGTQPSLPSVISSHQKTVAQIDRRQGEHSPGGAGAAGAK